MKGTFSGYDTLLENESIRLLHVFYSDADEPRLCGVLTTFSLFSQLPIYAALSYTWDTPVDDPEITAKYGIADKNNEIIRLRCNDGSFWDCPIGRNLFAALRQIVPYRWRRSLWIDALCINQSNVAERNSQVQLMDRFYTGAERVICWLGPTDKYMDDIVWLYFQFVGFLIKWRYRNGAEPQDPPKLTKRIYPPGRQKDSTSNFTLGFDGSAFQISRGRVDSLLTHLERRRYFRRLWVLQEVVLAKKLTTIYGSIELHAHRFKELNDWLSFNASTISTLLERPLDLAWTRNVLSVANVFRQERETVDTKYHNTLGLANTVHQVYGVSSPRAGVFAWLEFLLSMGQFFMASVAHDYLYGVRGLASAMSPECGYLVGVIPRYDLPLSKVFTDITIQLMLELPYLNVFSLLCPLKQRKVQDLPSWVPDLSATSRNIVAGGIRVGEFRCYGHLCDAYPMRTEEQCSLGFDSGSLRLYGRRCGHIFRHIRFDYTSLLTYGPQWANLKILGWGRFCVDTMKLADDVGPDYMPASQSLPAIFWTAMRCSYQDSALLQAQVFEYGLGCFLRVLMSRLMTIQADKTGSQEQSEQARTILADIWPLLTNFGGKYGVPQLNEFESLTKKRLSRTEKFVAGEFEQGLDCGLGSHEIFATSPKMLGMAPVDRIREGGYATTTDHRYIGACPVDVQSGDELWILCKATIPQILRPVEAEAEGKPARYKILGEAYVYGGMWGELVHNGSVEPVEDIMLI